MMKEIDKVEHFQVPEGYFEKFNREIMDKLPEQDFQPMKLRRKVALWPRIASAAAVAIAFVAMMFVYSPFSKESQTATAEADMHDSNSEFVVDEAAEMAMIDHQGIYEMISE